MQNDLIVWDDDFLVGYEAIDAQHKELVRLTNEFYTGVQMGGVLAKVFFMQTVKAAIHYVKTHFALEEEIMLKTDYPNYEGHKKQHENFIDEVNTQVKIFEQEDSPDPAGFVRYLMDWVVNHIAKSDKSYAPYLEKIIEK